MRCRVYDALDPPCGGSEIYYDVSSEPEAVRLIRFLEKISKRAWVQAPLK